MTYTQIPAVQRMTIFIAHLRELITTARFADEFAASLWAVMKADAERNLELLEESSAHLKDMTEAEFQQFTNMVEFSSTTLGWAQGDDLVLIEALSASPRLLLKRLTAVRLIVKPQQATISGILIPHVQSPAAVFGTVQAFLDQLPSRGGVQGSDPSLPDWNTMTASKKTPTQVGVYS